MGHKKLMAEAYNYTVMVAATANSEEIFIGLHKARGLSFGSQKWQEPIIIQ